MRWELQDTGGSQADPGDAKRPDVLFHVNDFLILPKEDQIDGKQHPNGMNAVRRYNPKGVT